MFNDDILSVSTQEELEKVCKSAQLSMRADMEYMVMNAVREAYNSGKNAGWKKGYDDGYNMGYDDGLTIGRA